MPRYALHGLVVQFPVRIDGFLPAPEDAVPDLDVAWATAPRIDPASRGGWHAIPLDQKKRASPVYRAWRHDDLGYLWHCSGPRTSVEYHISPDLRRIEVWRNPALSLLKLMRPAFGQALAFLLRARGRLLLHAAGIEIEGRAVLLVGASGHGKSTLLFELLRQGCHFLSDDMALPDFLGSEPVVHAGHGTVKLLPDVVTRAAGGADLGWPIAAGGIKREAMVTAQQVGSASPIAAIVVLDPRGTSRSVVLEPISAGEAIVALMEQIHPRHLPVGTLAPGELPILFERLSRLVARAPVLRLRRPDRIEDVPEAARAVIAALNG